LGNKVVLRCKRLRRLRLGVGIERRSPLGLLLSLSFFGFAF
jgi:hypothetical protein